MEESERYRGIIKSFRDHFDLTQENVEHLAMFSSKNKYSRIESGRQEANLNDVKRIATVYGISSSEMLKEQIKFPSLQKLPLATKEIVVQNRKSGKKSTAPYNHLGLTTEIKKVLSNRKLKDTFVASEIFTELPVEIQKLVKSPSKITDRFAEELSAYVEKTGEKKKVIGKKGRLEEYYRLIRKIE